MKINNLKQIPLLADVDEKILSELIKKVKYMKSNIEKHDHSFSWG